MHTETFFQTEMSKIVLLLFCNLILIHQIIYCECHLYHHFKWEHIIPVPEKTIIYLSNVTNLLLMELFTLKNGQISYPEICTGSGYTPHHFEEGIC